jgi:hypothetical protein
MKIEKGEKNILILWSQRKGLARQHYLQIALGKIIVNLLSKLIHEKIFADFMTLHSRYE